MGAEATAPLAAFSAALRLARLRRRIPLRELAAALDLRSHATISAWESGRIKRLPRPEHLRRLSEALAVPLDYWTEALFDDSSTTE